MVVRSIVSLVFFCASVPLFAQPQSPTPAEIEAMKLKLAEAAQDSAAAAKAKAALALASRDKLGSPSPLTSLLATVGGTFWRNPDWVRVLDITADQQKKMDDIFQQYRLRLIDLTASLQKEELILEPFLGSTRPGPEAEPKILAQIDRIADARAELEKATSRMLMSILQVLNAEQWTKLPIPPKKGSLTYTPAK
jgi:Spy/CpxP family protein refolding chaperone